MPTLKDTILELYAKEFNPLKMTEEECPGFQIEYFPVLLFLSSALTRYKEEVLKCLPEKIENEYQFFTEEERQVAEAEFGKAEVRQSLLYQKIGFNSAVQLFKDNINKI